FIQAGQSAKKTFTAALKPVEYHELLNKYEIFFLKNSKIFVRYFRKHCLSLRQPHWGHCYFSS
ncbi:MAG: hypothetical protein IJ160_02935, partial [Muribaculaceae bacterium]|nr:hypothetical protein [Muribaculaceae bacterium]